MELETRNIHRNRQSARVVSQVVVDDDYNVPDSKPDAVRILCETANVEIEQKKVLAGRIVISGKLHFRILYGTNEESRKVQVLEGQIPVEETIIADGVDEKDEADVRSILDELQIGLINSRKISIKAVITLIAEVNELTDEEIASDICSEEKIYTRYEEMEVLQLLVDKKDILRIKEEIILENSYPNIFSILWYDLVPFGITFRTDEGKLQVLGELQAFVMYQAEDENHTLQWLTKTFPLKGELDCPAAEELSVEDIRWQLTGQDFTAAQDFDGEDRIIHIEGNLELNIQLYREEKIPLLTDAYSTVKNLMLKKEPLECEQLLMNNRVMVKVNSRVEQPEENGSILQSCHGHGKVQIEQVRQTQNGLEIDGNALVTILYIRAEDALPLDSVTKKLPFHQVVDIPEITPDCRVVVRPQVENLEIATVASNQLDVKLTAEIHIAILCKPNREAIKGVEETALDPEKVREMPGMTGYIVKEGDTMWEIAKENLTTIDDIKELNQLQTEKLQKGQRLIIVKNAGLNEA